MSAADASASGLEQSPAPAGATSSGAPAARGAVGASARLLRSELRLILGRRRNQVGLVVLAAVPVLISVAIRVSGTEGDGDLISTVTANGVFVAVLALSVELALFLPLAVSVLSGDSIAGEAQLGTLRYLLTVPVPRTRLLAVKYLALVVGGLIGVGLVAAVGVLAGGLLLGLGPITLLSGTQITLAESLVRLVLAVAYVSAGMAAVAAIGLFISTLTEQPIAATIATTVVVTAMWIMDALPQLDWLHPWLLVDRWPAFTDAFRDPVFWDVMRTGLIVDGAYIVVFLALAWARFAGKDVTS
jgi:ABC-2 type transport system permease protein